MLDKHLGATPTVGFLPDGQLAARTRSGAVLLDGQGKIVASTHGVFAGAATLALAVSPDGRSLALAAASREGQAGQVASLDAALRIVRVTELAASPRGLWIDARHHLATLDARATITWADGPGQPARTTSVFSGGVHDLDVTPAGEIVRVSGRLLRWAPGATRPEPIGAELTLGDIASVRVSPRGERVAVGSSTGVAVLSLRDGAVRSVAPLAPDAAAVRLPLLVRWFGDERLLVVRVNASRALPRFAVALLELTGRERPLAAGMGTPEDVAVSPDRTWFALASAASVSGHELASGARRLGPVSLAE